VVQFCASVPLSYSIPLANFLFIISKRCCFYQLYFLCNFSPSSRCSTRISPWTILIHTLHYSQFSFLWFVCRPSSICWWTQLFISFRAPEFSISPPTFYTYKIQLISSLNGCLQIFFHSISLKLSFFLLVCLLNYLKSMILLFYCLQNVTITLA